MKILSILIPAAIFAGGFGVGWYMCHKKKSEALDAKYAEYKKELFYAINGCDEESQTCADRYFEETGENVIRFSDKTAEPEKRARFPYNKVSIDEFASQVMPNKNVKEQDDEGDDEPDDEEDEGDDEPDDEEYEHEYESPFEISYEEYTNSDTGYEKNTLYYYVEDGVVCEDDDSIVNLPEDILGDDFDQEIVNNDVLFIQNDNIKILYELHRVEGSYERSVQKIIETPGERAGRHLARRKASLDS